MKKVSFALKIQSELRIRIPATVSNAKKRFLCRHRLTAEARHIELTRIALASCRKSRGARKRKEQRFGIILTSAMSIWLKIIIVLISTFDVNLSCSNVMSCYPNDRMFMIIFS
jgi:hypothetical protein